jgi:glycosyltransferase involved in cell wall biosynthesis
MSGDKARRLRIVVITNMYPPHHFGGYELSCKDVVDHLRARGHTVVVLTGDAHRAGRESVPEDHVRRELRLYWDDHRLLSPRVRERLAIEHHNLDRLKAALAEVEPDVVSVWNMAAVSLGLLSALSERGLPLLLAICNDWLVFGPDLDAWSRLFRGRSRRPAAALVRRLTRIPTRAPDLATLGTYCFVSDATRRWARDVGGLQIGDSTVVYSGIAIDEFKITSDRPQRAWAWRLLHVGRIAPERGIETAVRALARLPAATLSLVGPADREELTRLERLGTELGVWDRVSTRERPRSELREEYLAADALVFPSVWEEPFGLTPVEAMACGTPVVATGAGGSGEFLVDGVNALLFGKGDHEELVEALQRLAADEALRARLVRAGTTTAAELTVEHLADVFEIWHVAVADRFAFGRPSDRQPPRSTADSD